MAEVSEIKGFSCSSCSWSDFVAVDSCPLCHSAVKEVWFPGKGKIASFTVIRYPPQDFEKEAPYVVALVDIENGPRTIARVTPVREDVQIADSVTFLKSANGVMEFKVSD